MLALQHAATSLPRSIVGCAGEGYHEDVTFEGLPGEGLDVLPLGDTPLGEPLQRTLLLVNHSNDKHFRCGAWRWLEDWAADWVE